MTPEQELVVRRFYTEVAQDNSLFAGNPVGQRHLLGQCLNLLNYTVIDGKYVGKDKLKSASYGTKADYTCQWEEDTRRVQREANKNRGPDQTNSSEPSTDTPIRKTVLPEDLL